jgi:D-alanyl-D-alanine carboxypeptidase
MAGVDGLKTGFTNGAGFCLAATAQRNGRRVIVVTMGSTQSKERDLHVTELIERGFRALPAAVPTLPGAQDTRRAPMLAAPAAPGAPAPSAPAATEPVIKFALPKTAGKP